MSLRSGILVSPPQYLIIPTAFLIVIRPFIGFAALLIGPFSQLV